MAEAATRSSAMAYLNIGKTEQLLHSAVHFF
jgi:hypothetical protein